jgi:hypothetical protein
MLTGFIMKSKHNLPTFCLAICMMAAGTASAAITAYVDSPQANSTNWTNAVTGAGGVITNLNFNDLSIGPLTSAGTDTWALNSYQASHGVTFAVKGRNVAIANGVGPADMGIYKQNAGEGTHPASNYMRFPSPGYTVVSTSITLNFNNPVGAVGFNSIDLCSWSSCGPSLTIEAFSGLNATGTSLGSATAFNPALFQPSKLYFMGLVSSSNDIGSFQIRGSWQNGYSGDNVGFDDFRVAAVPEPAEWAMLIAGLFVVGFIARRRNAMLG